MSVSVEIWAVVIAGLLIAIGTDIARHRIPNGLTLTMAVTGLLLNAYLFSWSGVWLAVSGLLTGLLCFLPLHVFSGMGAGDVKLLAALGSLVGPSNVFLIAVMTIISGGVVALAYIAARGGIKAMIRRYQSMLMLLLARQPKYLPPEPGEAAGLYFPYTLSISLGTAAVLLQII